MWVLVGNKALPKCRGGSWNVSPRMEGVWAGWGGGAVGSQRGPELCLLHVTDLAGQQDVQGPGSGARAGAGVQRPQAGVLSRGCPVAQ